MAAVRSAADKLQALRALMRSAKVAAYIVPTSDAHNSEYVSERDMRRKYLSHFTGSAGTAVVTHSEAKLWTDGRYYLQATQELDATCGWGLMKDRLPETPTIEAWLASVLAKGDAVGIDPSTVMCGAVKRMSGVLDKAGITLKPTEGNLVDAVWGSEQPPAPSGRLVAHPIQFSGVSTSDKLAQVREVLAKEGCAALVVTALDEVAWLFNVRGSDVECNPVAMAYGLVTSDGRATLCVDPSKLDPDVTHHLTTAGVALASYGGAIAELVRATPGRLWMDPASCNYEVYSAAVGPADDASTRLLERMSPVQLMKAVKNECEARGMREAHVRDGAVLTTFLSWLEAAVTRGVDLRQGPEVPLAGELTEATAGDVLDGMRGAAGLAAGLSFPTIAGYGPNGAVIHYRAEPGTARALGRDALFLLDSGGQYKDGTTDVTRTLHFGAPTERERRCFTRVLQGFIGLGSAVFPPGTGGIALDALARAPLWRDGLDYRHGTGHGVGAYLNVHEGPQYIASQSRSAYEGGLIEGMTITDEPGCYLDGEFGIRTENVLLVVRAPPTPFAFGGKPHLTFEHLTQVPICTRLVEPALLAPAEREWLNAYNARVRETLAPLLSGHAAEYLQRETQPL